MSFDPETITALKADLDSKNTEIARLESLLRRSALETEEKLSALQRKNEEEANSGRESQQNLISGHELKIAQLEEEIRSLEAASAQKNSEFDQLQRLVQEQTELVELAAQQEISDLKSALEDSNTGRLKVCTELETLQRDHSTLLLKLQHTEESMETVKVEKQSDHGSLQVDSSTEIEELKQQLLLKERELADMKENGDLDVEMRDLVEQRDKMIANLRSELEKTFSSQEDFENCRKELGERINKLLKEVEQKSTELNEAEDKLMHLQLESVDAKLQIEQLCNDKSVMTKRNSDLSEQNAQLTQSIIKLEEEKSALVEVSKTAHSDPSCQSEQLGTLQDEISQLTKENKLLREENSDLSSRISELSAENERWRETELRKPDDISGSDNLADNLAEIAVLKQQISDLQQSSSELSEKVDSLTQINQDLTVSEKNLTDHIAAVTQKNVEIAEEHATEIKALNEQLIFAKEEVARLSALADLPEQSGKLLELEHQMEDTINRMESAENAYEKLVEVVSEHERNSKELNEQLLFAQEEHRELSDTIAELKLERDRQSAENSPPLTPPQDHMTKILILRQQVENFNKDLQSKEIECEARVQEVASQLISAKEEITKLSSVISNLSAENEEILKRNKDLENTTSSNAPTEESKLEISELENKIITLTEQIAGLNQRIVEMSEEQMNTETSLSETNKEKIRLASELDTATRCVEEANQKIADFEEKLKEMGKKLDKSDKENSVVKTYMAEVSEAVADKENELAAVKSKLEEAEAALSCTNEEKDRLKDEITNLSQQANQADHSKTESREQMKEMETKLAQSEKEIQIVKTCMAELSEVIEEKENELEVVKSKLTETEALLAASTEAKDEAESNLNQSKHCLSTILETSGCEAKSGALQDQLNNKIAEVATLENRVKSLEASVESKVSESSDLKAELKKYSDMIDSLRSKEFDEFALLEEKAILEEEISSLQLQVNSHVVEIKEIEAKLEEKTATVGNLENQANSRSAQLLRMEAEYEEKLAELEKKITELNCKLAEEVRAKNSLRSDCDELMTSLQRKERAMKGQEEEQVSLSQLEETIKMKDRDIAEKIMELQECVKHIENSECEQQELHKTISQLNGHVTELKSQVVSLTTERDAHSQQNSNLTSQLQSLSDVKAQCEQKSSEIETMKTEILTLIQGFSEKEEENKALTEKSAGLETKVKSSTEECDRHVQTISDLNSQLQMLTEKESELSCKLSAVSNDLESKNSSMEEYESVNKELVEAKELLKMKSEKLIEAEEKIKELESSKDNFSKRRKMLEDQIEELQKNILEYEMMKTSYIHLKSEFDSLQSKHKLCEAAQKEVEKDLSEYQHYHESTMNTEKAKYQQLTEKHNELTERLQTVTERLKQDMVDQERQLTSQIETLTSDRNDLAVQVKEYSAKLTKSNQEVANLTEKQDSMAAKLKSESDRCFALENKKVIFSSSVVYPYSNSCCLNLN